MGNLIKIGEPLEFSPKCWEETDRLLRRRSWKGTVLDGLLVAFWLTGMLLGFVMFDAASGLRTLVVIGLLVAGGLIWGAIAIERDTNWPK